VELLDQRLPDAIDWIKQRRSAIKPFDQKRAFQSRSCVYRLPVKELYVRCYSGVLILLFAYEIAGDRDMRAIGQIKILEVDSGLVICRDRINTNHTRSCRRLALVNDVFGSYGQNYSVD
jgi:hypothetical protein